jgi:hypothetical protein
VASAAAPPTGKSLSQSLGLAVYPAKQQSSTLQSSDEFECYNWSKEQSGYDPMTAHQSQQSSSAQESSAKSGQAVKGAAGGAAIGAIAGNAGAGAAAGAVAGGIKRRSSQRKAEAQQQSAQSQSQAAEQANLDAFKKGMSACLEGRGYTVK